MLWPRVYPRACGGTLLRRFDLHYGEGLSPRMRGNPCCQALPQFQMGSIPAHAGEPHQSNSNQAQTRVYPRACGGTIFLHRDKIIASGLSPRMRGNPSSSRTSATAFGSIPAHAGEPPPPPWISSRSGVYPRACGGTSMARSKAFLGKGLSPRMRGNRLHGTGRSNCHGSIPAHAGEPSSSDAVLGCRRVYPRACGGTMTVMGPPVEQMGLSPRMRGNPVATSTYLLQIGSIPAHAGEPCPRVHKLIFLRVYPRACGGTMYETGMSLRDWGLSPRMRGNRQLH